MNRNNGVLLTQDEIDLILTVAVFELAGDNGESAIEFYDGQADNPFMAHEDDADFEKETSCRLMDEYRKVMAEKELLDNPFE